MTRSHSTDLLAQAQLLALADAKRPRQANLKRAVSACYYALFHLLSDEAAHRMVRGSGREFHRNLVRRAMTHGEMRNACQYILGRDAGVTLQGEGIVLGTDLLSIASTFLDLQQEREQADYDLRTRYTRPVVLDLVSQATTAVEAWDRLRGTAEGDYFLLRLPFRNR